jgi:hypothetical protein
MFLRSNRFFSRASLAALILAAPFSQLGASTAKAQWLLNWDRGLQPMQIERMVEASGYRLTGPVMRNGAVYLANVLGRQNDRERLVIDARDGRLLQRYSAAAARRPYGADSDEWADDPRSRPGLLSGWFDRDDDSPTPRPPANVYGQSGDGLLRASPLPSSTLQGHSVQPNQFARAEDPPISTTPSVIPAPSGVAPAPSADKPKPKPQVKHKKPEPTPVAQPASPPTDAKPAAVADRPAAAPAEPQTAVIPQVAATPKAEEANPVMAPAPVPVPAPVAPRVAETKPIAAPTPEAAPATPSPDPQAKAARPKPALNDVPVAPLE